MNWMQNLAATYDNCQSQIGYSDQPKQRPLLPICHITQQAHIEITINGDGNFRRARIITDKEDSVTIVPSTEGSASRAGSKPENHPICDKLQYVAGDFIKFGGVVTSGFSKDTEEPHRNYTETLTKWCNSEFSHPKTLAILKYIQKNEMITDLANHKILFVGTDGKFLSRGDVEREKDAKDIFSVVDPQENAFVRWVVEDSSSESRVWRDKTLWESWTSYYLRDKTKKSFCYVTGENQIVTNNHPKYIRWEGDGAKLISANDTSGFTFRGRFLEDNQACEIGLEESHKAHHALLWLISRQGYNKDGLSIVAWAKSGAPVPQPTDDPMSLLIGNLPIDENQNVDLAQDVAIRLKKKIAGYRAEIGQTTNIVVMAMDSAITGKGRMAIIFYRDLNGSDFLQRIENWHETCAWRHTYGFVEIQNESGKTQRKYIPFIGAPAPFDIAEAAYGTRLDKKLRKATVSRLLPCIVDGQSIPRDLVESVIRRASNRAGLEDWEWNKMLSIACALFKKSKEGKEKYEMSLDETRTTRDYLYGRLLAVADVLEEKALKDSEGKQSRPTNAARYMQQFSQHPFRTWKQIHDALTPYILRLGGKATYYKNRIAEISELFDIGEFKNDDPLSGEYLLGYYCQWQELHQWKKSDGSSLSETDDENSEE